MELPGTVLEGLQLFYQKAQSDSIFKFLLQKYGNDIDIEQDVFLLLMQILDSQVEMGIFFFERRNFFVENERIKIFPTNLLSLFLLNERF